MIPEELEQLILRLHLVEGWRPGTIARQVGVHHNTVKRVLRTHGVPRKPAAPRPSIVDPYRAFIEETLVKSPTLPASCLYAMCVERGYPGTEGHFRSLIARMRPRRPAEAYLRLRTLPAEEAQVDWADFGQVRVGKAWRRRSAFVMVLSWSRMPFVRFFYDQRMGSFLAGHVAAFAFFKGVPRRCLYDNLKSAVLSRHGDAIQFNPTLLALARHYRYEPRPAAPYRGNEKGRVERRILHLRTSFWAKRPHDGTEDLDDLNDRVQTWCLETAGGRPCPEDRTLTVAQAWADEQPRLRPLADDAFPAEDQLEVRCGKQPYVRFDLNDYSVPHDHVRRTLTVRATPTVVRVLDGGEVIARHERSFDKGAQVEDPEHLRALTAWKRDAREQRGMDRLHHATPSAKVLLQGAAQRGHNLGSAVAGLLRLLDTWGPEAVESAVIECIAADALHVAAVRQTLDRRQQEAELPPPSQVELPDDPRVRELTVVPHALRSYDGLGGPDV
ncbi:MAG: IS21 family transposase [Proteobacteria bacterium]|nr:IS21 family transposase [Pseudomonadota bacterium]